MQYSIRHVTRFEYDTPISESVMEVRMCPRTDVQQQCYSFELSLSPHSQLFSFQDFMGNIVHHFDIPAMHEELVLESRALVEVRHPPELPPSLPTEAWDELDRLVERGDEMEMTMPSAFARPTPALEALGRDLGIGARRDDPLSLLRELNSAVYSAFEYNPQSTHANSPVDDALRIRSGVCQDFAHIFIALVRPLGIPCRYVSGYLFHRTGNDGHDRSAEDGSHAWVEAFLPELGWIGFDPTNDILAEERHIRVALGRDYADVPPTRGTYKGSPRSTLRVGVHVAQSSFPRADEVMPALAVVTQGGMDAARDASAAAAAATAQLQEQQ